MGIRTCHGWELMEYAPEALSVQGKKTFGCYLFGEEPSGGCDRINSGLEYATPGNAAPCCLDCNKMKQHVSEEVFLSHVARICEQAARGNLENKWEQVLVAGRAWAEQL